MPYRRSPLLKTTEWQKFYFYRVKDRQKGIMENAKRAGKRGITALIHIVILLLSGVCQASDTTRIFFVGNSFTYYNNMPDMVKGFADAAGKPMVYAQHTPGGVSVGDIAQDTLAHWMNPSVFSTLRQGNWDYTVLQDNQGRFIYSYGSFPATTVSQVIAGHIKIADSMHGYNPCAHMLLFAGWGPKSGYLPYSPTGVGLIDSIYGNYHFLNDTMQEIISPIGIAWRRSMSACPGADLWGPDSTHPSAEGSYLTAAVIFSSIFRSSPADLNFTSGLDTAIARQLRIIAWQTVMDSLTTTNLSAFSVPVTFDGISFHASGSFVSWQWYRNDSVITDSTSAGLVPVLPGSYTVYGTDSVGCVYRSVAQTFNLPVRTQILAGESMARVFPNPVASHLNVYTAFPVSEITIQDFLGKQLYSRSHTGTQLEIDVAYLPAGLYFLKVNGLVMAKFLKE